MTAAMRWRIVIAGLVTTASLLSGAVVAIAAPTDDASDTTLSSYLSGNGLLNRGLYDLAAAEYRKFLDQHPAHAKAPVARYGLAVCMHRGGDHKAAIVELDKLVAQAPRQFPYAVEVAVMLGQSHVALQQYDQALTPLSGVIVERADHALADDAAAVRAEAEYRLQRYADVIKTARLVQQHWADSPLRERTDFLECAALMGADQAAAAAPKLEAFLARFTGSTLKDQAQLQLARCRSQLGQAGKAVDAFRPLTGHPDAGLRRAALLEIAVALLDADQPDEARRFLKTLLGESDLPADKKIAARFETGRCWFASERFEKALEQFTAVVQAGGARADQAAYLMGKCMMRLQRFDAAARHLQQVRSAMSGSILLPEIHYDHAVAQMRAGDDTADITLQAFVQRYPQHNLAPEALRVLASNAHGRQDYDGSRQFCEQYLGQFENGTSVGEVLFLLGENEYLAGRYQEAVQTYGRYLAAGPAADDARRANFRQGMAYYRLGDHARAAAQLQTIVSAGGLPRSFAPALLALGDMHFKRERWAEAHHALNAYLDAGPDASAIDDCLIKMTLALQRQKKHEPALNTAQRLIDDYPNSPHLIQAVFEQGQTLVALGRSEPARRRFTRVVREAPDSRFSPHAMRHLAALAMEREDYAEAAELLARVEQVSAQPTDQSDARFRRGLALLAGGEFEQAEKVFADFAGTQANHPRAAEARARQAIALSRLQRWDDALAVIEQVQGADLDDELAGSLVYEKAWCLRRTGRESEAGQAYRQLVKPGQSGKLSVHATLELAELEYKAERHAEAATLLRAILEQATSASGAQPKAVLEQALYLLGMCEFQQGNHAKASQLLERFISEFTQSEQIPSALYFAGEAAFKTRQHAAAVKNYDKLTTEHSNDPACEPALLRLGESLAELQKFDDSERAYTRYLRDFQDGSHLFQARFGIGWARENLGRHEQAIAAYRKVLVDHQGETAARAQFQIGECLFAQESYQDAVTEFLKVDILYDYPEWSAAALYEAGRCFEQLAQGAQARDHYRQVAEKFGESRWASMAKDRLDSMPRNTVPGH